MAASGELLRPALEAALDVARAGRSADPPVAVPPPLRQVVRMRKQTATSFEQVRRALDDDPDLRRRAAAAVDERRVGRAGWLFLTRPDGWEAELAALEAAADQRDEVVREEQEADREERRARKRVASLEERLAKAQGRAERAVAEADAARADLADERRARRRAVDELEPVQAELDRARQGLAAAEAERDRLAGEVEAVRSEVRLAVERAEVAEAQLARAEQALEAAAASSPTVARGIAEAAEQAAALAERLAALSSGLERTAPAPPEPVPPEPVPPEVETAGGATPPPPPARRGRAASRRPRGRRGEAVAAADLPPGVLDGTDEAATHLVRTRGAAVLVDGYNVTKRTWGDAPLAAQRDRLVGLLDRCAARWGVHPVVVFDGADLLTDRRASTRSVNVRFSPEGVTADTVILQLVEQEATTSPVVVVSSDREVQDGARARGAAVLAVEPFLAAVRG